MKKRVLCTLCCALMLTGLVGCNNSETDQSQQNVTTTPGVGSTIDYNDIETDIDPNEDDSTNTNETKESNDEDAATLYKEVVDNMNNAKNYHTEQKTETEEIQHFDENNNISSKSSINIIADFSYGKTDDGNPCIMIHSKSTTSMYGVSSNCETYEMQDPNNIENYYAYYEKDSYSTDDVEPKWEDKTQMGKAHQYNIFYSNSIKNIKFNKNESTSEIKVLEGDLNDLLRNELSRTTTGNIEVETKIKIKIDAINKFILESEIYMKAETEKTGEFKVVNIARSTQTFSKINKNITVKIPDTVVIEAKQSSESSDNNMDDSVF